ncbi:uncharacterized protein PV09_00736 [Verruconis gallopava]|uniref:PH domain-containing protein n=1 Tax=Verruconis gallopava TaxID=253628 RepID=A0A0D1Z763_9PEZI|nr:uncharacterized protein PV09_00736 [Verruconis gallopava]KIW08802.1 hypothetical protein PV09_00736 [Verruconis gallopava]
MDLSTVGQQLDHDSYTYNRLLHSTPEHLYLTTRRAFIGPIPEGWLRSHRRDWYRHHLRLNYSSKSASFTAREGTSRQKRLTGLQDGPSPSALYKASFPQPEELVNEDEDEADDVNEEGRQTGTRTAQPPAISIPRNGKNGEEELSGAERTRTGASVSDRQVEDELVLLDGTRSPPNADVRDITNQQERLLKPPSPRQARHRSKSPPTANPEYNIPSPKKSDSMRRENEASDSLRIHSVSSRNDTINSHGAEGSPGADASTSSLLAHDAKPLEGHSKDKEPAGEVQTSSKRLLAKVKRTVTRSGEEDQETEHSDAVFSDRWKDRIHFDLPENVSQAAALTKARITQLDLARPIKSALRRRAGMDGRILKMEKMLVRIDVTVEKTLPEDYDENGSQGIVTRTLEKWREFMVVCRQSREDLEEDFVLQIWKTRVIPAIENKSSRKKATRELPLNRNKTRVNLYSSLDKSVVLWVPAPHGTRIIILRPSTTQSGIEWFTFLRSILGWHRTTQLVVNIPDMSVSLRIENPFQDLEDHENDGSHDEAATGRTGTKGQAVAQQIIDRCLTQLKGMPEWEAVVDSWASQHRIGLAWKRYDRLEWIFGVNERKMYGTIALARHMDLELRAKEHYPTHCRTRKGKVLTEPPGVEGFLVRLTSQKGIHQRMGKLFFKRLFLHTHDQFLFFTRPAAADPPPPPKMPATMDARVPTSEQISEQIPLIYAVNPYPVDNGQITWLKAGHSGTTETRCRHDQDALDEHRRNIHNLSESEGFINLCDVRKVRNVKRGADQDDEQLNSGSDIDFDEDAEDTWEEDGTTDNIDDTRTFELALNNGLVIRLQAFDRETKKEWKKRLRALVKYWRYRHKADIELLKAVRKQNLEELQIDEETEAMMGQFAKKWEVTRSFASSTLHNMCGISCCRTIHMKGLLYFKPRLHKLFTAMQCVLIPGKLIMFETLSRTRSGHSQPTISHERIDAIDLKECYLYSGLLTENDLLYQNRTFDSNNPGHSALPRMWLDDQWTSRDEDVMCCFVLWRPLNKGWFRSTSGEKGTRLKRVTKLGATGRSCVFRARSRAERDKWVLTLAAEIERLKGVEDVRLVD